MHVNFVPPELQTL